MKKAFTLVEMAIVLVIIGFIVSMGIMSYAKLNLGEKYKYTKDQLSQTEKLVFVFAQINKRFPCPDVDGDGKEDYNETTHQCNSETYYKDGTVMDHIKTDIGDIDYSQKQNVPPYLYPYVTVGGLQSDAFNKPIRYDVNFLLAKTTNMESLCNVARLFAISKNLYSTSTSKYKADGPTKYNYYNLLPIATNDSISQDNELIDKTGQSVAGILISEGENPGVSNIDKGSNMEYASEDKELSTSYTNSDDFDDVVKQINYEDFLNYACGGFKTVYYTANIMKPQKRCIALFIPDQNKWVEIDGSDLNAIYGDDDLSSNVLNFSTDMGDKILVFNGSNCNDYKYSLADIIVHDYDANHISNIENDGSDDMELTDKQGVTLFTPSNIWYSNDGGTCYEVGEGGLVRSLYTDLDSDKIKLYKSKNDCENNTDPIGIDLTTLYQYDKNADSRVYLVDDGSGNYSVKDSSNQIYVKFDGDRSYLDKNFKCHDHISNETLSFNDNDFTIFFKNDDCTFNSGEYYLMDQVIYTDMMGNADSKVVISDSGLADN